jgi:hypothetical protein
MASIAFPFVEEALYRVDETHRADRGTFAHEGRGIMVPPAAMDTFFRKFRRVAMGMGDLLVRELKLVRDAVARVRLDSSDAGFKAFHRVAITRVTDRLRAEKSNRLFAIGVA